MKFGIAMLLGLLSAAGAATPAPCRIEVVEKGSGWPVPLVDLRTAHNVRFVTDNAGLIAFDLPELMGRETWFFVAGQSYAVPADAFGFRGVRLTPQPGKALRVEVDRTSVARRLGRLTGAGLFAESQKLGESLDWRESGVIGCDSVQNAAHRGRMFWLWGDTGLARYPLGIFDGTSATTSVQPLTSFEPPVRLKLDYLTDDKGQPRGVANMAGSGPTWLTGYVSLSDKDGAFHLVATYMKIQKPMDVYENGLCVWNDGTSAFEPLCVLWTNSAAKTKPPPVPDGHPVFWKDSQGKPWVLFGNPLPTLRCPATFEAWKDPSQWKTLEPQEAFVSAADAKQVKPHSGSMAWNAYRKRWVTVFMEAFGKPSAFGELWYAEASAPTGPWGPAVKVLSHDNYTFYNPRLHPEFTLAEPPILLFEGTFSMEFATRSPRRVTTTTKFSTVWTWTPPPWRRRGRNKSHPAGTGEYWDCFMKKWLSVLIALAMYSSACPAGLQAAVSPYALSGEGFFGLLDLQRPELSAVRQAVEQADWAGAKQAWATHLEKRQAPRWLWSRRDKAGILALYEQHFGGLAKFTAPADKAMAHDFDFEGVRKQVGRPIQWDQGRVEWTHVLSRFGYWNDLGRAYWATGNRAYAAEFVDELKQWVASNPVPDLQQAHQFGSRWRVLEAGIRGQGWFDALEYFMDAPEFDAEAKFLMSRCLAEHARYLSGWEGRNGYAKGNWQVAEATGLACIGVMLPEFKEAAAWRSLGLGLLAQHMEKDVLPDGAHWELTPGYHTWVMMEFLRAAQLCKLNGIEPTGLLARHEKMFEFLMALAKPNRCVPSIGDAGEEDRNIQASLGLGALLYHRADMKWLGCKQAQPDWLWLLGLDTVQQYAALPSAEPSMRSVLWPDSQYAVMRTGWRTNDSYLLFDSAPWHGGHSHCDQLQVLAYAGRDLIIEPGICSYDQPQAAMFRKSAAHNVVLVDGRELPKTDPKLVGWQTTPEADFAAGLMEGTNYQHQRSVLFIKPSYWVVVDHILGEGEHEITRLFHLPRGSDAKVEGNIARTAFAEGTNIQIVTTDGATLEMREGIIPVTTATFATAPVAAFVTRQKLPAVLCTILIPFTDPKALPVVSKVVASHPLVRKLSVKYPGGQSDELAFANEVRPLHLSGQEGHGRAFIIRNGPTTGVFELGNWAAKP